MYHGKDVTAHLHCEDRKRQDRGNYRSAFDQRRLMCLAVCNRRGVAVISHQTCRIASVSGGFDKLSRCNCSAQNTDRGLFFGKVDRNRYHPCQRGKRVFNPPDTRSARHVFDGHAVGAHARGIAGCIKCGGKCSGLKAVVNRHGRGFRRQIDIGCFDPRHIF